MRLSGFDSSIIGIGALSVVLLPTQVVPAFLAVESLTTVNLLPSVRRQIEWRALRWVIAGCAVTTPLGLTVLATLDSNPMRLAVSGCLLAIALLMLSGLAQRLAPRQRPGAAGDVDRRLPFSDPCPSLRYGCPAVLRFLARGRTHPARCALY